MLAVVLFGIGMGGIVSAMIPLRAAASRLLLPILLLLTAIASLSFLLIFPGDVSYESNRCLHGVLAPNGATLPGFDVPRFISFRDSFSDGSRMCPKRSRKSKE